MALTDELRKLAAARGGSKALQEATTPKKGVLRSVFDYLDLPGNVIQNILLKGNFKGAGRNLVDFVTKTATLGLLDTDLTRPEDRPDVGIVGEIVLDPLTYIGLPAAKATKLLQGIKAGKVAGKGALQAVSKSLTRPGLKAVTTHASKNILPTLAKSRNVSKLASRVAKRTTTEASLRGVGAKAAQELGETASKAFLEQLATRKAQREVLGGLATAAKNVGKLEKAGKVVGRKEVTKLLQENLPDFLKKVQTPLQTGGIRVGLPFTTAYPFGTVALEGMDVLAEGAAKYTLPGIVAKQLGRTKAGQEVGKFGKKFIQKFAPTAFASENVKDIVAKQKNVASTLETAMNARFTNAIGDIPVELRKGVGKAINSPNPADSITAFARSIKDIEVQKKVVDGLVKWSAATTEMGKALKKANLLPQSLDIPRWVMPSKLISLVKESASARKLVPDVGKLAKDPAKLRAVLKKFPGVFESAAAKVKAKGTSVPKLSRILKRVTGPVDVDILADARKGVRDQAQALSQVDAVREASLLPGVGAPKPPITDLDRLIHGTLESRRGLLPPKSIGEVVSKATEAVAAGSPSAAARLRHVAQVTNKLIPTKLGAVSHKLTGKNLDIFFRNKGTKPMLKLKQASDGVYELVGQVKGISKAATTAAAYRAGAAAGVPVRVSNKLAKKLVPQLGSLLDSEVKRYLGNLGAMKPNRLVDFLEKNVYSKFFRKGVTVGLGPMVTPAFAVRNILTATALQAFTDPQMRLLSGTKHLRPIMEGLIDKTVRKFGLKINGGDVFKILREDAIQNGLDIGRKVSKIDDVKRGAYTGRQILQLAKDNAVIQQGFAGVETLEDVARKTKWWWPDWAGQSGEFIENSFRMNAFIELLEQGVDPVTAGKSVSRMFVDYRYQSNADRTIRALFPFSRFTIAQTPVTLETIARRPRITQPLRALMAASTREPRSGFLTDAPNIPLGETEEGQQQKLARVGTPFEDLTTFGSGEGFLRTVEGLTLGRLHPLARTPLEFLTDRSFFKGQPLDRPVRTPALVSSVGGPERVSGLTDLFARVIPVSRQVNEISKLLDSRRSIWARSIDFIAGAKIYEVDKDVELKRMLRDYLAEKARQGDVGKIERFFATGDTDEELTAIIKNYYKVGKGKGKRGTKPPAAKPGTIAQ